MNGSPAIKFIENLDSKVEDIWGLFPEKTFKDMILYYMLKLFIIFVTFYIRKA
jgi:hypothetical protein